MQCAALYVSNSLINKIIFTQISTYFNRNIISVLFRQVPVKKATSVL